MGDPILKTREVTDYYIICDDCGKEERTDFNSPRELCDACSDKKKRQKAKDRIAFMEGATVTDMDFPSNYSDEISSITILTPCGRTIKFEIDRFGDSPHIEWNDIEGDG